MLNYVNYNQVLQFRKSDGYDDFGISKTTDTVEKKCYYRESDKLEPISSVDGSVYLLKYVVVVEGDCDFSVGDKILIEDSEYIIRSKNKIRDFDFNIISTKFEV